MGDMRIVPATKKNIATAAQLLRAGGVVAYPTDTAYGLGGIFNISAVEKKILRIKNRRDKKFVVVAGSMAQVERFFPLNASAKRLAKKYWPGPLSIVVNKKFSVRVPAQPIARRLCLLAKAPLIATSANISGQSPAYSVYAIKKQFANRRLYPDMVLDAGRLKKTPPSTVVAVKNGDVTVIRPGSINLFKRR